MKKRTLFAGIHFMVVMTAMLVFFVQVFMGLKTVDTNTIIVMLAIQWLMLDEWRKD